MKVRCRTNIDKYKGETWPEKFCVDPRVGDIVEAKSGMRLKIVQITHKINWREYGEEIPERDRIAYLEIELHTSDGRVPL